MQSARLRAIGAALLVQQRSQGQRAKAAGDVGKQLPARETFGLEHATIIARRAVSVSDLEQVLLLRSLALPARHAQSIYKNSFAHSSTCKYSLSECRARCSVPMRISSALGGRPKSRR